MASAEWKVCRLNERMPHSGWCDAWSPSRNSRNINFYHHDDDISTDSDFYLTPNKENNHTWLYLSYPAPKFSSSFSTLFFFWALIFYFLIRISVYFSYYFTHIPSPARTETLGGQVRFFCEWEKQAWHIAHTTWIFNLIDTNMHDCVRPNSNRQQLHTTRQRLFFHRGRFSHSREQSEWRLLYYWLKTD